MTVYQAGVFSAFSMENDNMADKLENEYLTYKKTSPQERVADFNRCVEEIRYVNGLVPRPMTHHNDTDRGDNQNQR